MEYRIFRHNDASSSAPAGGYFQCVRIVSITRARGEKIRVYPAVREDGYGYAVRSEMRFSDDSTTGTSGDNHTRFLKGHSIGTGRDGRKG